MNYDLTEMYIKEVIDKNLFGQRLLMWVALNATLVLGQKNFSLEEMWTWRLFLAVAQSSSNRLMSAGTNHLKTDFANSTTNVIKKSFRACGINLSQCGGQDNEISVFKAGRECEAGLEMLKAAAAEKEQEFEEDPYEEEHLLADSEDEDDEIVEQDDGDISED